MLLTHPRKWKRSTAPPIIGVSDSLTLVPSLHGLAHGCIWRTAGAIHFLLLLSLGWVLPANLVAAPCAPVPASLISWWHAEGDANDVLGVNDGLLQGGAGFAAGKVGQAFSFDGVTGFVQVSNSPSLNFASNAPLTIELWAYRTGGETTMHLIGKREANCGSLQYEMSFDPYGGLAFYGGGGSVQTKVPLPTNVWMHLAATFDGTNTLLFYTNGVLAGSGSGNLGPPNTAPLTIGASGGCFFFAGLMDEVTLYGRALSADEIQSIYNAGTAGKCFIPPVILAQPQAVTVLVGGSAAFSVMDNSGEPGVTPENYQWRLNGTNIAGATDAALLLTNLQTNQSGDYSLKLSNADGSTTSSNALLTVIPQVSGVVMLPNQAGLLSALAAGGHVTFGVDGVITLSQTINISEDTVLDGAGHTITINGSNAVRVFYVNTNVHFTLMNLTVANGSNVGTNGGLTQPGGTASATSGLLYNDGGTVDVINCAFIGNSAVGGIGEGLTLGIPSTGIPNGGFALGGAIFNEAGSLNITNSAFSGNSVSAGPSCGMSLDDGGSPEGNAFGGAIHNDGGVRFVNVEGSSFVGNQFVLHCALLHRDRERWWRRGFWWRRLHRVGERHDHELPRLCL